MWVMAGQPFREQHSKALIPGSFFVRQGFTVTFRLARSSVNTK
ncbi:hypothetical protein ALT716_140134 [Alteromonas macleodii]